MQEHSLPSLEHVLQMAFQRVEPPPRFVHGLGHKIRAIPTRPIVRQVNGAAFLLLLILMGTLFMGAVSILLAHLLRRRSALP